METEGKRINSKVLVHDDFIYRKNSLIGTTCYYVCVRKSCRARAKKTNEEFVVTKAHNHEADPADVDELTFKASCKRKVLESSSTALKKIFDEQSTSFGEGSRRVTYSSFGSTLQRLRSRTRQPVPNDPTEFGRMLLADPVLTLTTDAVPADQQQFYRGMLEQDGVTMLLFASETMVTSVLKNAATVYLDASFEDAPEAFPHLFTIHAEAYNYLFPCVYALMTSETEAAYNTLLQFVGSSLCPEMNPINIMSDYRLPLRNPVSQHFPKAAHFVLLFHYTQSVWRYVHRHGLLPRVRKHMPSGEVVRLLLALPLLPWDNLEEGISIVEAYAAEEGATGEGVDELLAYVREQWIEAVGAQMLSAFGQAQRTNNSLKTFHRSLARRVDNHQNVWKYLAGVQRVELFERQVYDRLRENASLERIRDKPKPRTLLHNASVVHATTQLLNGRYSVREFLTRVGPLVDHWADATSEDLGERRRKAPADEVPGPSQEPKQDHAYSASPGPPSVAESPSGAAAEMEPETEAPADGLDGAGADPTDDESDEEPGDCRRSGCGYGTQCLCSMMSQTTVLILPCRHMCFCQRCGAHAGVKIVRLCKACAKR